MLSMILTRQDDEAGILHPGGEGQSKNHSGRAGPSGCSSAGDGQRSGCQSTAVRPGPRGEHPRPGGRTLFGLAGVPWSWAYPISSPRGTSGYLVVGAETEPPESERFLLRSWASRPGWPWPMRACMPWSGEPATPGRQPGIAADRGNPTTG